MASDRSRPPPAAAAQARLRLQVLLEVLNGSTTGAQAARRLGVSRKTWCQWQARGTEALHLALSDRATGRPALPRDAEKDVLRRELERRQQRIRQLEAALDVNRALREFFPLAAAAAAAAASGASGGVIGGAKKKP